MVKKVHVYVIRHGNYDAKTGSLTEQGQKRVQATAQAHLTGRRFGTVLYSGMQRTLETVHAALGALGHQMPAGSPIEERTFGYEWAAADDPQYYSRVKAAIASGRPNTAAVWREHWTNALKVSDAVQQAVRDTAKRCAASPDGAENALVGSHEFVGVSATLDPTTPCLNEADIIRYDVQVGEDSAEIVGWDLLPAPAVL